MLSLSPYHINLNLEVIKFRLSCYAISKFVPYQLLKASMFFEVTFNSSIVYSPVASAISLAIFLLSTSATAIDVSKFPNQESISYTSVDILPDGGKDYTYFVNGIENHYFVPPEDFNPLTASDAELAMYYFPPRPDTNDKASYSEWIDIMSNYTGTPEPEGMISTTESIIEQKPTISPLSIGSRNSNIWSGYESNLGASSSKFYTQVQMDYTQPAIKSISGTCINSY